MGQVPAEDGEMPAVALFNCAMPGQACEKAAQWRTVLRLLAAMQMVQEPGAMHILSHAASGLKPCECRKRFKRMLSA